MIFHIDNQVEIDTDRDLTSAERHVVQKLLGWKDLVSSVEEFRKKKQSALSVGWNNSGPLAESEAMALLTRHLEKELRLRLQ